jgi:D123
LIAQTQKQKMSNNPEAVPSPSTSSGSNNAKVTDIGAAVTGIHADAKVGAAEPVPVRCLQREMNVCQFQEWYPLLKKYSFPSISIELSDEFVEYLLSDGVYLPPHLHPTRAAEEDDFGPGPSPGTIQVIDDDEADDWGSDHGDNIQAAQTHGTDSDSDSESESEPDAETRWGGKPFFPELIAAIDNAIVALGGAVLPKLNWSAPKDATWIASGETIECNNAGEVLLLLKSSDFIAHDLTQPYEMCSDADTNQRPDHYHMVLREWKKLIPSREFRCFVCNNTLRAISQRDHMNFYDHLTDEKEQQGILAAITTLFDDGVNPPLQDRLSNWVCGTAVQYLFILVLVLVLVLVIVTLVVRMFTLSVAQLLTIMSLLCLLFVPHSRLWTCMSTDDSVPGSSTSIHFVAQQIPSCLIGMNWFRSKQQVATVLRSCV